MTTIAQIFIVLMAFALVLTFIAKVRKTEKYYEVLKMLKSLIFVLAGLFSFKYLKDDYLLFAVCLMLGLMLGFLGDFALEKRRYHLADQTIYKVSDITVTRANSWFKIGMASFLVGHIAYIIALQSLLKFNILNWVFALISMTVLFLLLYVMENKLKFLKLNFGKNGDAIYFYNIVLSILVGLAIGEVVLSGATALSLHIFGSVALFYISDFILVLDYFSEREKKPSGLFEALNLVTYYGAQLGLAFIPLFLK